MSPKTWARKLFAPKAGTARRPAPPQARLGLEVLADRLVPTALAAASLVNQTLTVTASPQAGADVTVGYSGQDIVVTDHGQRVGRYNMYGVVDVKFTGGPLNDRFQNLTWNAANASGGGGHDVLIGGYGNDTLAGGDGNDTLAGGGGWDTLTGGAGDDDLSGDTGDDTLDGGDGGDRYRYNPDLDQGSDTVGDAGPSGSDHLDLSAGTAAGVSLDLGKVISGVYQRLNPNLQLRLLTGFEQVTGTDAGDTIRLGAVSPASVDARAGNDRITGSSYGEYLRGGPGDDVIEAGGGNDYVDADQGSDTVSGGYGDDTLMGGQNDDVLYGEQGHDYLDGGDGADRLLGDWAGTAAVGGSYAEFAGNDTLRGGYGADSLDGGAGADALWGDQGNDALTGGAGDDTYKFNADLDYGGWDTVHEYGANGTDTLDFSAGVLNGVAVDLAATGWQQANGNLWLLKPDGMAVENVIGSGGADLLSGTDGPNRLEGRGGSDWLEGKGGNDVLAGGLGGDRYYFDPDAPLGSDLVDEAGGGGSDTLDFSHGTYYGVTLDLGAPGSQWLNPNHVLKVAVPGSIENVDGTDANDLITGTDGANFLDGNAGDDHLDGRGGNDTLYGHTGNDVLVGGDGADWLDGGNQNNVIMTGGRSTDWARDVVANGDGWSSVLADRFDQVNGERNVILRTEEMQDAGKTYTLGLTTEASFIFGGSTTTGFAVDRDGIYTFVSTAKTVGFQASFGVSVEFGCYNGTVSTFAQRSQYSVSASVGLFKSIGVGGSVELDESGRAIGFTASVGSGVGLLPVEFSFTYESTTSVWDLGGHRRY